MDRTVIIYLLPFFVCWYSIFYLTFRHWRKHKYFSKYRYGNLMPNGLSDVEIFVFKKRKDADEDEPPVEIKECRTNLKECALRFGIVIQRRHDYHPLIYTKFRLFKNTLAIMCAFPYYKCDVDCNWDTTKRLMSEEPLPCGLYEYVDIIVDELDGTDFDHPDYLFYVALHYKFIEPESM